MMYQMIPILINSYVVFVTPDFVKVGVTENEAAIEAKNSGNLLPTPELVDLIYKIASCKPDTTPKVVDDPKSYGQMEYEAVYGKHFCENKTLVAGHYKNVVVNNGKSGIYGWWVKGEKVQNFFSKHSKDHRDYSQAFRLVKPVVFNINTGKYEPTKNFYQYLRGVK